MGFFKFLDLSSTSRALEHDVSFDLKYTCSQRKMVNSCKPTLLPQVHSPTPMPIEIVMIIMEAAYYDESLLVNEKFLRNCALVCRDWSIPAQRLLFRHVILRTQSAYQAFHGAVDRSNDRGRVLGDSVIRMRVVMDHKQPLGLSQDSFAHAVTMCPNLRELHICLYGCGVPGRDLVGAPDVSRMQRHAPSFDETTLSLLKAGPRITALQFSNWSENRQSIVQLLSIWPSLKSLVMKGTPPELPSASSEPFPCALESLRMNFQTTPPLDFMKWLLHNSTNSLRILELEREPSPHFLDYLVETHGANIRSLALAACSSPEHALAVQKCRHLEEFTIENPWASPMAYRKMPEGLQHIAFGLDRDTSLRPVLATIKSREALRAVTVQVWDGGEEHPQLAALKIACTYRGIDLRFTYDIRVFRAMIRGDPFLPRISPRVFSIENPLEMCRCS